MKKIKYIIAIIAVTLIFTGCGDNFLKTNDLYELQDASYYSTPAQIDQALAGAYACLPTDAGLNNPTLMAEMLSDDCLGGGGVNDQAAQAIDAFQNYAEDLYLPFWTTYYQGIFRTNMILKRFDQAKYSNVNAQNQAHGEAYFLRAYFYFKLAEFFGTVPLITDPGPYNNPKAKPEVLYGQIASDLKNAIEMMPATKYQNIPVSRLGHATKWAAEGLMARVFLFYTGYYQKSDLPLAGGGSITRDQVINWVDECVATSGHGLIPDFRNLWPYAYDTAQYPYAKDNHLNWIGEDGANIETVFAIKYSPYGGWNPPMKLSYSNQLVLYNGMRGYGYHPWAQGWGFCPVNPQLVASFDTNDVRLKGSIFNVTDPEEGDISTTYHWDGDKNMNETGLWQKKYMPVQMTNSQGNDVGMYDIIYPGAQDNYQLWNMQDEVLIRFSDILLMGAELGSSHAQEYLDEVRKRAGLPSEPVTLANIKLERRHELAFEGLRYFDLLRWHDAQAAFAKATDIPVKDQGKDAVYKVTFRPETGGFMPIPESQIRLSNGVLVQNPGW